VAWGDGTRLLTNFHVVAGVGKSLELLSDDGRRLGARLLAGNPRLDLAVLAIEGGTLEPLPMGDSTRLRVGELVFAVGNPWGNRGVVTAGVVSGVGELPAARGEQPASYIRSDVRLAPGNSGGPLLNARGELVGINAMIFGGDLSVAIPAHVAVAWANRLPGRPVQIGLGVQPAELPPTLASAGQRSGLLVAQVARGGPAERAGVLVGDLLLRLGTAALPASEALIEALGGYGPGDTVALELARGGVPLTLSVTLAEKDAG
jgi:serine protease Do